jgi:hypothetical protein
MTTIEKLEKIRQIKIDSTKGREKLSYMCFDLDMLCIDLTSSMGNDKKLMDIVYDYQQSKDFGLI